MNYNFYDHKLDTTCEVDSSSLYVWSMPCPKKRFEMPKWAEIMRKYVRCGLIGHDPDSNDGSGLQQAGPILVQEQKQTKKNSKRILDPT